MLLNNNKIYIGLIYFLYKFELDLIKLICFKKKSESNIFIKQIKSNKTLSKSVHKYLTDGITYSQLYCR